MTNENVDISIVLPILKQIPLFANLDENLHKEIVQHIVLMYYPAKYTIFKQGDAGDALYLIKKGQVKIVQDPKEEGGLPKTIGDIGEGGFFGEMALVSEVPRNATVQTLMDCEVFILNKEYFKKILETNPALSEQISATVVSRVNKNNSAQ